LEIAMGFKTILVPIEQHDFMDSTLKTALLLARRFDSYIEGFALRVAIPAAFAGRRRRRSADTGIGSGNRGKRETVALFSQFPHSQGSRRFELLLITLCRPGWRSDTVALPVLIAGTLQCMSELVALLMDGRDHQAHGHSDIDKQGLGKL
jgi:hypothetical protein